MTPEPDHFSYEALTLSYDSKGGHGYGNQKRRGSSGSKRGLSRGKANESAEAFRQWAYKENPQAKEQREFFGAPVSVYTSDEAVGDGLLFDLDLVLPHRISSPSRVAETPVKFITSGLLAKGYANSDGSFNVANIMDLVQQSGVILSKMVPGDRFASGRIELPSGDKQQIFIAQNETGRFTAMLPEDY